MSAIPKENRTAVKISQDEIADMAYESDSSSDFVGRFYRRLCGAIVDQDNVEATAFAECNKKTWSEICERVMTLDRKSGRNVMPGGIWMNVGPSTNDDLEDYWFYPPEFEEVKS